VKDINFLAHEKLLSRFREIRAHLKKVQRAKIRGDTTMHAELKNNAPSYELKHLVKERYPSFVDALRDLDDPLNLINLFATLQHHKALKVENKNVKIC
jgi:pescadillo